MVTTIQQSIISNQNWSPTPLSKASTLSKKLNVDLWLKREDCTAIGSFKIRGALISISEYAKNQNSKTDKTGICVASAGNFAIAIATATVAIATAAIATIAIARIAIAAIAIA